MTSTTLTKPGKPAKRSADEPNANGFTHKQVLTIMSGLLLGMFLAALDQTVVATSIRTIADDLKGYDLQAWATTAFLITSTITTPLYGKLSDLYGRKPFFMFAISVFIVGSFLCGLAQSMYMLAGFRALQGLGAGGLLSLALTIIGDIVPARERARYQGYFLATFGTSSVLGPLVGGTLAGQSSILGVSGWRWIFWVNVPIGLVALVVVFRVLHLNHTPRKARIDWGGAATLALTVVPLLVVAEQGRGWGWGDVRSLVCYVLGAVGLVSFLTVEKRMGEDALLPFRIFSGRTVAIVSASSFITGIGMFGALALLPQYLQVVKGSSPTAAGLQTVPLVTGIMVGSIVAGQTISRTGKYKPFPIVGSALMVTALFLFHYITASTPLYQVMLLMALFDLGLGGNMQPLVLAIQNAVRPTEIGVATASSTFFRQMGATAGTAVFLSIFFSTVGGNIASRGAALGGTASPDLAARVGAALQDTSKIGGLPPVVQQTVKGGFADSMDTIFLIATFVVLVSFAILWFLPQVALRSGPSGAGSTAAPGQSPATALPGLGADVPAGVERQPAVAHL